MQWLTRHISLRIAHRGLHHVTAARRLLLDGHSLSYRPCASPASSVAARSSSTVIKLREYQEECIQAVLSSLEKGHRRLGISLATGAGKTVVFTQLIDRVSPPRPHATQTLILAHRQELVEQAARHCRNAYPDKTIDVEMGVMQASGTADITIASVQSIISGDRLAKFDPRRYKLVLVDEAHHIVAPGYLKTLAHFGLSDVQSEAHAETPALVGVSATLSRFDGLKLGAAIDHIVYHKDYIDMIGEKWLSDVIFTTVQTNAELSHVKSAAFGDFQTSELSRAVNTEEINTTTVRSWLAKAGERKSTLVFCVDLAHVASLTAAFRTHGIDARFVTEDTPKNERSARLDQFRAGEFPVLLNCGVFTEGTDVPNIDCVLLARPTKSRNLLVQMIGRGMRLFPGKKNCHIIDMVASLATGIVTTPTLFGLDPSEILQDASVDEMKESRLRKEAEAARESTIAESNTLGRNPDSIGSVRVAFTDYDSVFDLIDDTSGERHIRAISAHTWVNVSAERYILTSPSGQYLRLEKPKDTSEDPSLWLVHEIMPIPASANAKSPFRAPREIARALTFQDAVHAADTYAAEKMPRRFIAKDQAWRNGPATEGQLVFLNRLRLQDDQLTAGDLTKGKAGDMITKLKHGAKGRFAQGQALRKREGRAREKGERIGVMRAREQVRVGPVAG